MLFLEPEDVCFGFSPSCLENIGSIGSQFYEESSSQSSNCSVHDDQLEFSSLLPVSDSVDQMSAALAAISAEMLENSSKLDTVSHKLGLVEMEQNFFSESLPVIIDTRAIEEELLNDNFFFTDNFLNDKQAEDDDCGADFVKFPVGNLLKSPLENTGAVFSENQDVISVSSAVFDNQDVFPAPVVSENDVRVFVSEDQDGDVVENAGIVADLATGVFENTDFVENQDTHNDVSEHQDNFPLSNGEIDELAEQDIGDNGQPISDELDEPSEEELMKRLAALHELYLNFSRQSEEVSDSLADDASVVSCLSGEQDMEIEENFVETEPVEVDQDVKAPVVPNKFVGNVPKPQSFSVWLPLQRIEKRDFVDRCPVFFEIKTTESDELLQKIISMQNFDIGLQNKELLSSVLKGEIINELVERSSRLKKKKVGETYDMIRRAMGVKLTNRRFQQLRSLGTIKDILRLDVFHYTCPVSEIVDRAPAIFKESLQKATEKKRKSNTDVRPPPPKKPRTKCCPAVRPRQ